MHVSLSLHCINVQCREIFRALFARPQEALDERKIGDYCVQLQMWAETNPQLQPHRIVTNPAFV
jgi:hypothetical protein